ncbi:hypothetical protein MNBD_NITROSPINAE01-1071 [hydrothermal vent metagenome]|uniref:DUF4911 domain-containing protein n=1 Tax=hydrothermal vent metagenome TaxID=652676 RepID=A0A3B1BHS9_9ZZZZ
MPIEQTKISFPLPVAGTDCHRMLIKIRPQEIAYIVTIFEAYDMFGIARTVDQTEGILEILVSPDFVEEAKELIYALQKETELTVIRI